MEAVAEHINEMQKIYEEYGSIFDDLIKQSREIQPTKKVLLLCIMKLERVEHSAFLCLTIMMPVTRKETLRSLSYQKKDGHARPQTKPFIIRTFHIHAKLVSPTSMYHFYTKHCLFSIGMYASYSSPLSINSIAHEWGLLRPRRDEIVNIFVIGFT